jgi:peptidoglycan/LPS O-acetylase OafA/YrhL
VRSGNIRYIPQVDHLRALAAVGIVFYHGLFVIGQTIVPVATTDLARRVPTRVGRIDQFVLGMAAGVVFRRFERPGAVHPLALVCAAGSFGSDLGFPQYGWRLLIVCA